MKLLIEEQCSVADPDLELRGSPVFCRLPCRFFFLLQLFFFVFFFTENEGGGGLVGGGGGLPGLPDPSPKSVH